MPMKIRAYFSRTVWKEAMKTLDSGDYETPVEEYAGILGYTWDGELTVIDPALSPLEQFDFDAYSELIEGDGSYTLQVELDGSSRPIIVEPYSDIACLLEQIESLDVSFDSGPADGGPASGAGYLFFLEDGYSCEAVEKHVNALVTALRNDMASRV
jgi:hypothetical protein